MRIIQVDQQAKAVVNLVIGIALFMAAFVILMYRFLEPTQLQLYHSLSSSILIAAGANGIALLTYDLNSSKEWKSGVSRLFAVLAIIASVDGFMGSLFDSFDAQIHQSLYVTLGIAGLWMALRLRNVVAIRAQRILAALAALALAAILLMHFVTETPLLARHPTGSLVAGALVLLALIGLWNQSTATEGELPCVSVLTTSVAVVGLLISSAIGVTLFHNEMNELRDKGREAAVGLNLSRRAAGKEHVSTLRRLAERWENYPQTIHDELMALDMVAVLRDVDFLESLIYVVETNWFVSVRGIKIPLIKRCIWKTGTCSSNLTQPVKVKYRCWWHRVRVLKPALAYLFMCLSISKMITTKTVIGAC